MAPNWRGKNRRSCKLPTVLKAEWMLTQIYKCNSRLNTLDRRQVRSEANEELITPSYDIIIHVFSDSPNQCQRQHWFQFSNTCLRAQTISKSVQLFLNFRLSASNVHSFVLWLQQNSPKSPALPTTDLSACWVKPKLSHKFWSLDIWQILSEMPHR